GTPGLGTGRKIEKLGLRSSDTAEVVLDNVRLAPGQLIGEENRGYKQALRVLDGGRVGIAAWCHGIGRGALEESIAYVRERRRVPGPAVRAMESTLAEMAMRLEAGRVLLCRAAYLKDTGRPFRLAAWRSRRSPPDPARTARGCPPPRCRPWRSPAHASAPSSTPFPRSACGSRPGAVPYITRLSGPCTFRPVACGCQGGLADSLCTLMIMVLLAVTLAAVRAVAG